MVFQILFCIRILLLKSIYKAIATQQFPVFRIHAVFKMIDTLTPRSRARESRYDEQHDDLSSDHRVSDKRPIDFSSLSGNTATAVERDSVRSENLMRF